MKVKAFHTVFALLGRFMYLNHCLNFQIIFEELQQLRVKLCNLRQRSRQTRFYYNYYNEVLPNRLCFVTYAIFSIKYLYLRGKRIKIKFIYSTQIGGISLCIRICRSFYNLCHFDYICFDFPTSVFLTFTYFYFTSYLLLTIVTVASLLHRNTTAVIINVYR